MRFKQGGYTYIEAMFAVAIASILVALSVNFSGLVADNRRAGTINEFLSSVNFARSEAIARGAPVSICRSANQTTCGGAGGWEAGWIVFTDNGATPGVIDAGEQVLRVRNRIPAVTLGGGANVANRISFNAMGSTSGINGTPATSGTLTICDKRGFGTTPGGYYARHIVVALGGRAQSIMPTAAGTCP